MGNKNSGEHHRVFGSVGSVLKKRFNSDADKAEEYNSPQGHVDLLFEMLNPHIPDSVVNIIFLFELSLPRDKRANEIKIKEYKDIFTLDKKKLGSLQFGDVIVRLGLGCARQWIFAYSSQKKQFVLDEYHIRGLPFEYTKYVVNDPDKRRYWQYGFLIYPGTKKKEDKEENEDPEDSTKEDLAFEAKLGKPEKKIKKCIESCVGFSITDRIHCRLGEEKKVVFEGKTSTRTLTRTPQSVSFEWQKTSEEHSGLNLKGVVTNTEINRLIGVKPDTECLFSCFESRPEIHGVHLPQRFIFWVRPKR